MEITLNTRHYIAELVIESGNTKITENVAVGQRIHDSHIDQFLTIANDMSRFNNISDVDFVVGIFKAFLDDNERQLFVEKINEHI